MFLDFYKNFFSITCWDTLYTYTNLAKRDVGKL